MRYALVAATLLAGCGSDSDTPVPAPAPKPTDCPMLFGATEGVSASVGKKNLVGNREEGKPMEDGMMTLSDICTPSVGGRGIALWGDYCVNEGSGDRVEYFKVFQKTRLIYDPDLDAADCKWVYDGQTKYWMPGCSYRFRAYFPAMIEPVSSSNISTLSLEYPSHRVQEDLLVSYNEADTDDADFRPKEPVELYFRHTLAAIRLKLELDYASTDIITSCWFENRVKEDFAVGGILFCERRESGGRIFSSSEPPKESEIESYFQWLKGYCPEPQVDRFYKWSCTESDGEYNGMVMKTILDSDNNLKVETAAYAYLCEPENTSEGELFTRNGGWLLVIPQESTGNLQFCFQTVNGGSSTVFRVTIPRQTGPMMNDDGQYIDAEGNVVQDAAHAARYERWRAGKRYNYTVKIRKSDLQVSLAVADWNMRYSSTQIEF